ncbi:MAG: aromatic amino acid lyase [Oligoflexia bacterium]|nr:aromatic amino acid lyase [Oligoflexia bacterium]
MEKKLLLSTKITLKEIADFIFGKFHFSNIELDPLLRAKIIKSNQHLNQLLINKTPIYGVNTGLGESCFRLISASQEYELQRNLIAYLTCGTGDFLPLEVARGTCIIRLISLSKGLSGVSEELLERMKLYVIRDWLPLIPREGSLGASGDLIPLAYLAQIIQGNGEVLANGKKRLISELLAEEKIAPYELKAKEGLALVNGTSVMTALAIVNLKHAQLLTKLAVICTSWLCMAIKGRVEAFGDLVNKDAKYFKGQHLVASQISELLREEDYSTICYSQIKNIDGVTSDFVQDPYSLRCTPQILGPVVETLDLIEEWLQNEMNSVADNPLINENGVIATGGNFYGGYIAHGMDYLKISLGHIADLLDRQLTMLISDKTNRGLPANLANWPNLPKHEWHIHHGLKGLHQLVSAITSEIMAKTIPNSVFSRSSESHNQDKISLGMSASTQCYDIIESLFNIMGAYLICLAQALDLREQQLKSPLGKSIYALVRSNVKYVEKDQALDLNLRDLVVSLKKLAKEDLI